MKKETEQGHEKAVCYKNGKIYYSKDAEKKLFFILTIMMLLAGILVKAGII